MAGSRRWADTREETRFVLRIRGRSSGTPRGPHGIRRRNDTHIPNVFSPFGLPTCHVGCQANSRNSLARCMTFTSRLVHPPCCTSYHHWHVDADRGKNVPVESATREASPSASAAVEYRGLEGEGLWGWVSDPGVYSAALSAPCFKRAKDMIAEEY